jgi:hypothetical protein
MIREGKEKTNIKVYDNIVKKPKILKCPQKKSK